ncbi:PIN domain-containing protein [Thermococcus sp. GR7]|uniref:PIN domain-containing protein n=1 Tax=unclassified Thermococcus TaxID=2627626 RepID=UPI001431A9C2|nr:MULTISPECIES: PIN domain-containing protein [unclassified Thermococcus]NJE46301.1 PIN domain-containing protein [Thermococcus sp. GR7]NJE79284.1 PIN domain-containing protein [Thermococcus sp. GR4]NJF23820.1 PIN domain-containing protein [Thermococcus sp. GR5]
MHAVIDTNVLIYDTFSDNPFHENARGLLESLDRWYIPALVLQEYLWFFKKEKKPLQTAKEMIEWYVSDPRFRGLEMSHEIIMQALKILWDYNRSLSHINDAIILSHAVLKEFPLATFDIKLRKLAQKVGVKVLPADKG